MPSAIENHNKGSQNQDVTTSSSLDNFIVGPCNEIAFKAMQTVINQTNISNLILLKGGSGLGKTHLLYALNFKLKENKVNTLIMKPIDFTGEMVKALNENNLDKFRAKFTAVDVLLIDDLEFFVGKERSQFELTIMLETLLNNKKLIVISLSNDRDNLTLPSKLISLLSSGLHVQIDKPDIQTALLIIKSEMKGFNVKVDESTLGYLATKVIGSVNHIKGTIKSLIFYCHETSIPLNMHTVDFLVKKVMPRYN